MTGQDDAAALPRLDVSGARGIAAAVNDACHAGQAFAVTRDGQIVAVIIPPQDYHPPEECCCTNCPWGGNHA